jgi:glycosyltransferase A (GT-A) superfamily protein (DUF2064 family)
MTTLIVIAKETIPGRVKTRLIPDFTPEQAADLAAAAIQDTFAAVADLPFSRRILAFDGTRLPRGANAFEVIPQVSGGLDQRLGAIFDECDGPTVLVGMDTPQLGAADLARVLEPWPEDVDAWFGPAADGGFWALALARPDGDLIRGVPMSQHDTGIQQLNRLASAGLGIGILPVLTDVDTIVEATTVAAEAPDTRFAALFREFRSRTLVGSSS